MRNQDIEGVPLIIKWADGEKEMLGINEETQPKLYVSQIPRECEESNLKELFGKYGELLEL